MTKKALICTAFSRFVKSFLTNDIKILQSMGFEVHCATNTHHAGAECMPDFFKEHNVLFHQIDFSSNKPLSKASLYSYYQMKKLFDDIEFDVVHVHTPVSGAICRWACRKFRKNGTKVFYTTHGFYFHKGSNRKTWMMYHTIEDFMSKYSDAIITINREDYSNAKKMHCTQVFYIPGVGVDINKFADSKIDRKKYRDSLGIKENDVLLLAVGELSPRKNHRIIIQALSKCNIPNTVFMICGNAMTSTNTVDELKKMAVERNVELRLMGLRDDIPQICKCADIGVMPSLREGLGLSGIEMIASGLPIVASRVHGILDYVQDGVNGYLANPVDAEEFSEKIKMLYLSRNNIDKDICKNSVLKFDKAFSNAEMERIYRTLLDQEEKSFEYKID